MTNILAESASLNDAVPRILQNICEGFGWEIGELWQVDSNSKAMKLKNIWHVPSMELSGFAEFSREFTFSIGTGLPGRVWAIGQPVWITDVITDINFHRATMALKLGIHGAMAFPIIKGNEVIGAMVFFTRNVLHPDDNLSNVMADMGRRIGAFIDRRAAEGLLRASEHKHRMLLQNLPQKIFHKDRNSVYVSCNESYARDLRITPDSIVGKTDYDFYPTELAEKYRAGDKRILESGQTEELEEKYIKDGQAFIIQMVKTPIKDENGNVSGIIGIFWDITERKHLEETRSQLSAILEATSDFVATASVDGHMYYLNKAARRMIGIHDFEDVARLKIFSFHPERITTLIHDVGIPTAIAEGIWIGETIFQCRDGREVPVSQVIIAHKTEKGTVEYLSTIARDITERKRFEEQIVVIANRDPLTDLFNRRRFQEELESWIAHAKRFDNQGALLFLDLDNFKYINDSLGHQAGDKLLIKLASLLRGRLRDSDVLARLGGDEFAIILPNTDVKQAQLVADQIRQLVLYNACVEDGKPLDVTVSIGIALFPQHGDLVEVLLTNADLAMYRAKEEGRNRVCIYSTEQKTRMESRWTWENRIREALKQNRFVLYVQPILDLRKNKIVGHEALLRMIGEMGELIPPAQFLDIAERYGLIHDIDYWVVREAIHLIERLQQSDNPPYLEVNLSGKSLTDVKLMPLIKKELSKSVIDPKNLVFEITETATIENIVDAQRFVTELKSMGCRFALDDFGMGFSSFNYLKHLPVDYLKIDGTFIHNLLYDPVDQHLVKAMVEVACGLGKKTIAEFVENKETICKLQELGVDYAQGYHISKPHAVSDL